MNVMYNVYISVFNYGTIIIFITELFQELILKDLFSLTQNFNFTAFGLQHAESYTPASTADLKGRTITLCNTKTTMVQCTVVL